MDANLRLLLVGGGDRAVETELHTFFRVQGIEQLVTFAGLRKDVPTLLAAADLMIFPSRWEGLPGAVIEARISGLPVVASDLPGVHEIARHLGGVKILGLEADDQSWSEAGFEYLNPRRRQIPELERTPFSMHVCSATLESVWFGKPI
jgi:glycosyltransferase involved in cell wall biosynthesis